MSYRAVLTKMPGIRWAVYNRKILKVSGKIPRIKISAPPSCAHAEKLKCAGIVQKEQRSGGDLQSGKQSGKERNGPGEFRQLLKLRHSSERDHHYKNLNPASSNVLSRDVFR